MQHRESYLRLVGLFLLLSGLAAAFGQQQDYTGAGPCAVGLQRLSKKVKVTSKTTLSLVTVTLPSQQQSNAACPAGPFPVVVFFSGFMSPSSMYKPYATKLASYGYAVVQYDTGSILPVNDATELKYLSPLLSYLRTSTLTALAGRLDFAKLATAGHSRGGKLAALHLANNASIATAFLIDPVDNTAFSPVSAAYPSAVAALQAAQPPRVAGVAGAGVTGACNPADANYQKFYAALGAGSWLQLLPKATHTSFLGSADSSLTSAFCGSAPADATSGQTVQDLTATVLTAWMERWIRSKPMDAFNAWAGAQTAMSLTVKA